MKTLTNRLSSLILVAIVYAFAPSSSINAQEIVTNGASKDSNKTARLIVNRAADFGTDESVNLLVDGNKVAVLTYNERYDAPLGSGAHVLSITTDPKTYPQGRPKRLTLTAAPGKTYTFTAVWTDSELAGLVAN
jgi:hypothetical protein